jgi:hypothetical protein
MMMDAVVQQCAKHSPVTVMARLALQRALDPAWIDAMFERECGAQYTRELLFSTVVELMSVVAVGLRPSVHAAAQAREDLPVSIQALYDKIRRTQPNLVQALVAGSAERLGQIRARYDGMMMAVERSAWDAYEAMSPLRLANLLLRIASYARPKTLRKHPRGPKPPKKKGYAPAAVAQRHVSTARVLKEERVN